jgi:hypothetical protein
MGPDVTLAAGDELRVDRGLYHHHGIYLGNASVIQFGGGIKDKRRASIHLVSLGEFAKGARVKVVEHEGLDRIAAVQRALWLLEHPPPATYHLLGYSCEHVARSCATGRVECSQAQNAFALNSVAATALMALQHPRGALFGLAALLIGLLLAWLSRGPTRQFERHIRGNSLARPTP